MGNFEVSQRAIEVPELENEFELVIELYDCSLTQFIQLVTAVGELQGKDILYSHREEIGYALMYAEGSIQTYAFKVGDLKLVNSNDKDDKESVEIEGKRNDGLSPDNSNLFS